MSLHSSWLSLAIPALSQASPHIYHLQIQTQLTPEIFQIPTEIPAVFSCLHSFLKFIIIPTTWHLVIQPGLL